MSREDRKKRKTRFKFRTLILFIIMYFAFRSLPYMSFRNIKTMVPKEEVLSDSLITKGHLIKIEEVYRANNSGIFERRVTEGERVGSGLEVGKLISLRDDSTLEEELKLIDRKIGELEQIEESTSNLDSVKDPELFKNNLKDEIQDKISSGDYSDIRLLKENIKALDQAREDEVVNINKDTIENLRERRENIITRMSQNRREFYIPEAGLISYEIDGYEEIYTPSDFEKYTYEFLNEKRDINLDPNKKSDENSYEVAANDPLFKWIDNFQWYLAIEIEDLKTIKPIEDSRVMTVRFEDDSVLEGSVEAINKFKNKGAIVLRFTSKLHEIYGDRIIDIELLKSRIKGYKVPKSCVMDKKGIFIKDLSGIVRYRDVIIIGENEESYYLKSGDKEDYIEVNGEQVRTLGDFEEVILKPKEVKEGEIIN